MKKVVRDDDNHDDNLDYEIIEIEGEVDVSREGDCLIICPKGFFN